MQEMSIFSNTFFGLFHCFFLLASARRNPYPCLTPASLLPSPLPHPCLWAPPTHIHTPFGALSAFLFQDPLKMRKALKGRILSSLNRSHFVLLLRVACWCGEFYRSLFFLPFSLSRQSPPRHCGGLTWFSPTSGLLWGPAR